MFGTRRRPRLWRRCRCSGRPLPTRGPPPAPGGFSFSFYFRRRSGLLSRPARFFLYYYGRSAPGARGAAVGLCSLRGGCAPSGASRQTWLLPPMAGAPREHGFAMLGAPGDFLMRRKSPKTHQEPPGSWTSGEGGLAPFDPPALCPSGIGCGSLNPQASSGASHLPRHGLTAEGVTPGKTRGEKKTDLPTNPKWQIGLGLW